MSLPTLFASTVASERSRRGPRGVLGELRTRTGLEVPDPLSHLTLQERRMAFIEKERPMSWSILVRTWPSAQVRNRVTGNSRVRARLLDSVSRKLQADPFVPDIDSLIDFEVLGGLDDWLERHVVEARRGVAEMLEDARESGDELDRDDAFVHVSGAFEAAMNQAKEHAMDQTVNDFYDDTPWYEKERCHGSVEVSRDGRERTLSAKLHITNDDSKNPSVSKTDSLSSDHCTVADPDDVLPPWAAYWLGSWDFTDESFFETVGYLSSGAEDTTVTLRDNISMYDVEWVKKHNPSIEIPDEDEKTAQRWIMDWMNDWADGHDFWAMVSDACLCMASKEVEVNRQEELLTEAFFMLIDWRTANLGADIFCNDLTQLLHRALLEHIDDMATQELDRILIELSGEDETSLAATLLVIQEQEGQLALFSDGARIVEIVGPTALAREGVRMVHCIGQRRHNHPQMLADGTVRVFSYRDQTGKPRATWEAFTENLETSDLQGPHNGLIHDEDARNRMAWFMASIREESSEGHKVVFSDRDLYKLQLPRLPDGAEASPERLSDIKDRFFEALHAGRADLEDRSF